MLQAATRGAASLGPSAQALGDLLHRQQQQHGAFCDRAGRADLYYTIFGLEASLALGLATDTDALAAWLSDINLAGLDLVHACGLARIWADLPGGEIPPETRQTLREIIARHRSDDGGFAGLPDCPNAGAYGSFLAVGALQDLHATDDFPARLPVALETSRRSEGGFPASPGGPATTPTTAAAMTTLHQFHRPTNRADVDWLLARCDAAGGFYAAKNLHLPDLLSTAVACFTLKTLGQPLKAQACTATREFVLACRQDDAGFAAMPNVSATDCEYAFYALLALGSLEAMA